MKHEVLAVVDGARGCQRLRKTTRWTVRKPKSAKHHSHLNFLDTFAICAALCLQAVVCGSCPLRPHGHRSHPGVHLYACSCKSLAKAAFYLAYPHILLFGSRVNSLGLASFQLQGLQFLVLNLCFRIGAPSARALRAAWFSRSSPPYEQQASHAS